MVVKLNGEKVEVCNDHGGIRCTIVYSDAIDCDLDRAEKRVVVTLKNGQVRVYSSTGGQLCAIVYSNAVSARWTGDGNIAVRKSNGRTEIYGATGGFKYTI